MSEKEMLMEALKMIDSRMRAIANVQHGMCEDHCAGRMTDAVFNSNMSFFNGRYSVYRDLEADVKERLALLDNANTLDS